MPPRLPRAGPILYVDQGVPQHHRSPQFGSRFQCPAPPTGVDRLATSGLSWFGTASFSSLPDRNSLHSQSSLRSNYSLSSSLAPCLRPLGYIPPLNTGHAVEAPVLRSRFQFPTPSPQNRDSYGKSSPSKKWLAPLEARREARVPQRRHVSDRPLPRPRSFGAFGEKRLGPDRSWDLGHSNEPMALDTYGFAAGG